MFDRYLPQEVEFASDVCATLNEALGALHRLGYPVLWIQQPMTMGNLHMRQAEALRELRNKLNAIPKSLPKKKEKRRVSVRK